MVPMSTLSTVRIHASFLSPEMISAGLISLRTQLASPNACTIHIQDTATVWLASAFYQMTVELFRLGAVTAASCSGLSRSTSLQYWFIIMLPSSISYQMTLFISSCWHIAKHIMCYMWADATVFIYLFKQQCNIHNKMLTTTITDVHHAKKGTPTCINVKVCCTVTMVITCWCWCCLFLPPDHSPKQFSLWTLDTCICAQSEWPIALDSPSQNYRGIWHRLRPRPSRPCLDAGPNSASIRLVTHNTWFVALCVETTFCRWWRYLQMEHQNAAHDTITEWCVLMKTVQSADNFCECKLTKTHVCNDIYDSHILNTG